MSHMKHKEVMKFARAVVHKYLYSKPELQEFRQELEQEGAFALIRKMSEFDESYGVDFELWADYQVRFALQDYINRREIKHFKKPLQEDPNSPYWDFDPAPDPDELKNPNEQEVLGRDLMESLSHVAMSSQEQEFLEAFLESGDIAQVSEVMGFSRQRGHQIFKSIVDKAKIANDCP